MSDVLVREIAWRTPEQAVACFAGEDGLVWFDSQDGTSVRGRYSMLCVDPFGVLDLRHGQVRHDNVVVEAEPFAALRRVLDGWPRLEADLPVPFGGGAAGFFGYELACHIERLPAPRAASEQGEPDLWIGLYDLVWGFDHHRGRCWLISSGLPEPEPTARRHRAQARLTALAARIEAAATGAGMPVRLPPVTWRADLDAAAYRDRVRDALALIRAGDIFQVNLTTRHVAEVPGNIDALSIHLALRQESPAPFGAFLRCSADYAIACASPERFLRLSRGGDIETRPIKGTRPRHADPAEDERLRLELLHSAKDRAENLMIVDLMRNDLGRVARPGTVRVESLQQIESFASVHHMVSGVTARLRGDEDAVGLVRASFPGGSVTGAPKIRAMQIIRSLEPERRGAYCGSIAWIGFDGAMDSNIVIRSLVVGARRIVAQAGGAIVADSDPDAEYAEMMTKLAPMRAIFGEREVS